MKKIIISCLILIILVVSITIISINWNDKKENSNLTHVTVSEVTHSIFYAPQYLAHSLGYFEEVGLDVEITLSSGADAVMASVLSGDADIGFCGTEATIYVVAKKEKKLALTSFYSITNKSTIDAINNNADKIKIITGKLTKAALSLDKFLFVLTLIFTFS